MKKNTKMEGGENRVNVETFLTLSKSITVKSQVPIQFFCSRKRELNRNDHLGKSSPPTRTYIILISASPIIGLTRAP